MVCGRHFESNHNNVLNKPEKDHRNKPGLEQAVLAKGGSKCKAWCVIAEVYAHS